MDGTPFIPAGRITVSREIYQVIDKNATFLVHQCDIYDTGDSNHLGFHLHPGEYRFCIFSLRFSSDGNEILAGASDQCLYVYDRERNTRTLKVTIRFSYWS